MRATVGIAAPGALFVPGGTGVIRGPDTPTGIEVDLTFVYDYAPFADPDAPPFEHLADVIRVDADRTFTIDRDVVCISEPGRYSREKDT